MILSAEFYVELRKVKPQRWFPIVYLAWIKDNKIKNLIPLTEIGKPREEIRELNMFSGWGEGAVAREIFFKN